MEFRSYESNCVKFFVTDAINTAGRVLEVSMQRPNAGAFSHAATGHDGPTK
jgi:hypothetical protein